MREDADCPKKGDRYVVRAEFAAIIMTQWYAPYTGGEDGFLPAGLEFVVEDDPVPKATGVYVRPEPYAHWEPLLVKEKHRKAEKYAGFSVVVDIAKLSTHCARL